MKRAPRGANAEWGSRVYVAWFMLREIAKSCKQRRVAKTLADEGRSF